METTTEREAAKREAAKRQAAELVEVARRLTDRYRTLHPGLVMETVADVTDQLEGARIREFIPLLVEKQARDELDSHLRAAGGVPNPRTETIWVEA
jgi:hypothetical protein